MGLSHSPHTITDGLVLCLDAANRRSYPGAGTTWYDLSGNGNHGTLTNGPVFNGGVEGMSFDGVDDYAEIPSSSDFQFGNGTTDSPFSVSFWVNQNGFEAGDFIGRNDATATQRIWRIILDGNSGQFVFILYDAGFTNRILTTITPVNIDDGNWHHVVCTYDGTSSSAGLNIYFDNVKPSQTKSSAGTYVAMQNFSFPIWIARVTTLYSQFRADDIRIYNRALSANEVQQNYNATRWRFQ
jgi:hypothetical protein